MLQTADRANCKLEQPVTTCRRIESHHCAADTFQYICCFLGMCMIHAYVCIFLKSHCL